MASLSFILLCQQEKCAQYWPTSEELQMSFTDTGFVVRLLSEEDRSYYTIRVLQLQNTVVSTRGKLVHKNYCFNAEKFNFSGVFAGGSVVLVLQRVTVLKKILLLFL